MENKNLSESLKSDVADIISGVKKSKAYKSFFAPVEGGVVDEFKSKAVFGGRLLPGLMLGTNRETALDELVFIYSERLCFEAISNVIRKAAVLDECHFQVYHDVYEFINGIRNQPNEIVMISAEAAARVCIAKDFVGRAVDLKPSFMGIEEIGTYQNKTVVVNPYLPAGLVLSLNYGGIDFDLSLEDLSEFPAHFNITTRRRPDYLRLSGIKNMVEYTIISENYK